MKVYCISDHVETAVGLKLTGVETAVLKNRNDILSKIKEVEAREDIGILVLTESVYEMAKKEVENIRENKKTPLIVTIPNNPKLN